MFADDRASNGRTSRLGSHEEQIINSVMKSHRTAIGLEEINVKAKETLNRAASNLQD